VSAPVPIIRQRQTNDPEELRDLFQRHAIAPVQHEGRVKLRRELLECTVQLLEAPLKDLLYQVRYIRSVSQARRQIPTELAAVPGRNVGDERLRLAGVCLQRGLV
jgi:hypothetical protein